MYCHLLDRSSSSREEGFVNWYSGGDKIVGELF